MPTPAEDVAPVPSQPAPRSRPFAVARYLMSTDAHPLAFSVAVLALLSVALAAGNQRLLVALLLGSSGTVFHAVRWLVLKAIAIVASITIFFLSYWLLPNGHFPARAVAPAAVIIGLLW